MKLFKNAVVPLWVARASERAHCKQKSTSQVVQEYRGSSRAMSRVVPFSSSARWQDAPLHRKIDEDCCGTKFRCLPHTAPRFPGQVKVSTEGVADAAAASVGSGCATRTERGVVTGERTGGAREEGTRNCGGARLIQADSGRATTTSRGVASVAVEQLRRPDPS